MPRLIRTPEKIMRVDKKDLYFIEFAGPSGEIFPLDPLSYRIASLHNHGGDSASGTTEQYVNFDPENPPGREGLLSWFAANLSQVTVEPLAASEHSGVMTGGVNGRLRVDFDDKTLQVFVRRWEDANGNSIDPRFACYVLNYHTLKDRLYPLPER